MLSGPKEVLCDQEFLCHTSSFLNFKKFKPISGILTFNINRENNIPFTFVTSDYKLAFDVFNLFIYPLITPPFSFPTLDITKSDGKVQGTYPPLILGDVNVSQTQCHLLDFFEKMIVVTSFEHCFSLLSDGKSFKHVLLLQCCGHQCARVTVAPSVGPCPNLFRPSHSPVPNPPPRNHSHGLPD